MKIKIRIKRFFGLLLLFCSVCMIPGNPVRAAGSGKPNKPAADSIPDLVNLPELRWKFHTARPIMATPVISGGLVYVGGLDSVLYAFELGTGKLAWKRNTGGAIRSNALVHHNNVYLVGGDGVLYSFEKNTGQVHWKYTFNKTVQFLGERRYDIADYFDASPVVSGDTVYFASADGRVNAVNAQTGELAWSFASHDIIHATPALDGDKLFAGSFDGHVYALNRHTGALCWTFKSVGHEYFPKGEMQGNPVVFNGTVFVGSRDYNLYAINCGGGYCNWNQKFPKGWALANGVYDSVLYTGTSDDRIVAAIDPANGREIWRTNVGFNVFSPAVFSSTMLYVGNLAGKLFGIDRDSGTIRWEFTTDGYKQNHNRYFRNDGSFTEAFFSEIRNNVDYINAQLRWGAIFSSPAIQKNTIVISSTDGTVYCLGVKS